MYAIKLDENSRILSATFERYKAPNDVLVEALPEGDITDYKYIDGEYVYDPLPQSAEFEESAMPQDDIEEIKATLQTHDEEIDTIIAGLEGLTNG